MSEDAATSIRAGGETEAFSAVVASIYDCVFDFNAWPSALSGVIDLIGGCAASLTSHALPDQQPERFAEFGTNPEFSRSYFSHYGRINPLVGISLLEMAEGEMRTLNRSVDLNAFHRTRFYREWIEPQGWGDWLGVMLARTPSRLSVIAVARKEAAGSFLPEELRLVTLLIPHLQRATALGRVFDRRADREAGMTALLDRMTSAALLIDERGEITFANGTAATMLADGALMARDADGSLKFADPVARLKLRDAIAGVAVTPETVVLGAPGRHVVAIMPPSRETGGFVAVLVTNPEAAQPPPGPILKKAYGLTPAELRVLAALLHGRTSAEIADDLGVAPRTVKAHLQKLFLKTGVSRQSDLMRQVMMIAPPFG
jgi:DNA-binding CsgD family transcriptional regulator/PAS domain-containing protein